MDLSNPFHNDSVDANASRCVPISDLLKVLPDAFVSASAIVGSFAVVLNSSVIIAIVTDGSMRRKPPVWLIVNQCVTDIFVGLQLVIAYTVDIRRQRYVWINNDIYYFVQLLIHSKTSNMV